MGLCRLMSSDLSSSGGPWHVEKAPPAYPSAPCMHELENAPKALTSAWLSSFYLVQQAEAHPGGCLPAEGPYQL